MKHIFIVNPAAGKKDSTSAITEQVKNVLGEGEYEIYPTKFPGDAESFVKKYCAEHSEAVRFYACGGDGTLYETVNGLAGYDHASLACYPCGSGNDFVKYYGGKDRFLNLEKLIAAEDELIDVMKIGDRYCINVCNFGFDTTVAKCISSYKKKPLLGGKRAYYAGVVKALITSMKNTCTLTADGEELFSGKFLLCTVANGNYVGSSFKCAPRSENNDGLMEICLVKAISRLTFIRLVGAYTKGEHLDDKRFKDIIIYKRAKSITVSSPDKGFAYTLDGEVIEKSDFTLNTLERKIKFAVPKAE